MRAPPQPARPPVLLASVYAHTTPLLPRHRFFSCRSVLLWDHALQPASDRILDALVAPALGEAFTDAHRWALSAAFQALWLAPAYLLTMVLSSGM